MTEQDIAEVWQQTLHTLEQSPSLTERQLAFVRLAKPMATVGDNVFLAVPHEPARNFLENSLREELVTALGSVLGHEVRLGITVDPELAAEALTGPAADYTEPEPDFSEPAPREPSAPPTADTSAADCATSLNARFTFESFVVGKTNRFPHAAALAVAEGPARAYNPLFIYGGSGLGKTHLLHAIGHYTHNLFPHVRVRYVSSEEFTNDFINSIREGKQGAFQRRYRDVDVLLIDDIQFLAGKEQTIEEFFHTFNALHHANKQVVITSDVPPKQLDGFAERLRTRFEWGLITDIKPPDVETRMAILRKKTVAENLDASDEVLNYIASRIDSNIRELEGALIRVTAFANLNHQALDLALAKVVLADLLIDDGTAEMSPSTIITQAAAYFSLSVDDLIGPSRSRAVVAARHIAMYLCREQTDLSLPAIAKHFGGRDHSTVLSACRKIEGQISERKSTYTQVAELTQKIRQQPSA
ncbi:MAG: chromosomal replication initiator protein DnaA [Promicromonosporaceae bacterium]|nr:chromosomal replication initiator protein DnaA [Promicromonosporaceae bacterium]